MKLVVGLGNPGQRYEKTRHNVGFRVADELARRHGGKFRRSWRCRSEIAEINLDSQNVILAKPRTFMNNSGIAVAALHRMYKIPHADIVVVFDDVELRCGLLRIRKQGGAGGHQGVASVIQHLGTEAFPRVRVGIGPRPPGEELVNYVLSPFSAEEEREIGVAVRRAADAVERIVTVGVDRAMNEFNQKNE